MNSKNFLLLLFLSTPALGNSYIPYATTLPDQALEISLDTSYFKTTEKKDVDGNAVEMTEDTSHQRVDSDLILKYGLTNQLEGHLGFRFRLIQAKFFETVDSVEDEYSLTRSGFESYFVGFKYSFQEKERVKYAIHGYYRFPTYSQEYYVDNTAPEVLSFGEASRDYGAGLSVYFKTTSNNVFDFTTTYRSPSEDLSQEQFTRLQFALVWNYVSLYAGVENLYSYGNDAYSSTPEEKPAVLQGESYMFNSVNRQWTAPLAGMGLALGNLWRIKVEYAQVTEGVSTDLGPRISFFIARRDMPARTEFSRRNSEFKQYRVEANVLEVSKNRSVVVIDQGLSKGLEKGNRVDFYYFDFVGGDELIATGSIVQVKATRSLVQIVKRYSKKRLESGIIARADEIIESP